MIRAVVDAVIQILLRLLVRVRAPGLARVPDRGPLIVAVNHINFLDAPLIYTLLRPRRVIGMAKIETWDNPALRILANLWEAIPVRRGTADTRAFRRAEAELARGSIVVLAPEGTRSRSGRLHRANAGIVTLAARSGAPILPVAHCGGEDVWRALRRGRRAVVTVRIGRLIRIGTPDVNDLPDEGPVVRSRTQTLSRVTRNRHLDEVMYELARLLPERYRGHYGGPNAVAAP